MENLSEFQQSFEKLKRLIAEIHKKEIAPKQHSILHPPNAPKNQPEVSKNNESGVIGKKTKGILEELKEKHVKRKID